MKNQKISYMLLFAGIIISLFLFYEYNLSVKEYENKKIVKLNKNFHQIISQYKKILNYSAIYHLENDTFKRLINSEKEDNSDISNYIDINLKNLIGNEFKYISIVKKDKEVYNSNKINAIKTIELTHDTYPFNLEFIISNDLNLINFAYYIKEQNTEIAKVNFALDIADFLNNISLVNDLDLANIIIKKQVINDKVLTNKDQLYSNNYYELKDLNFIYTKSEQDDLKLDLFNNLVNNQSFVLNKLFKNNIYNEVIFDVLKDKNKSEIGFLVLHLNDDTMERKLILQLVKFITIVLMLYLVYSYYQKGQEESYTIIQLFEALNKVNMVSKTDKKGIITYVNDKFCEISGFKRNELLGKSHNVIRHEDMSKKFFRDLWARIKKNEIFHGVIKNKRKDNSAYFVNTAVFPLLDTSGKLKEYVAIRQDITEIISPIKQLEDSAKSHLNPCLVMINIAEYDIYTNIYPLKFLNDLENSLAEDIIKLKPSGLSFKRIYPLLNGKFGFVFDRGDLTLDDISILLKKFKQNLDNFEIKADNYIFKFNYIISFTTENKFLFENQEIAFKRYSLKLLKDSIICSNGFASGNQAEALKNLETIKMIEDAILSKNLVSHFQAIYNIKTEKIEKYESLVRIIKGEELISPYFFLDVAKTSNLHKKITLRILENSFKVLDIISEEITINLSAVDIEDVDIRNALLNYFTKPEYFGRITFEFLEDETIQDFNLIKDFISLARIMGGVKLAIDDFGSGYSNYERVVDIKPDILKIDGSLIKDIANNKSNQNIVKSIVQFAKSENIKTVAEFVADEETFNFVKDLEIDYAQGYYIDKPCSLS